MEKYGTSLKAKKIICVFQISLPYLGFCSDPKHFILKSEKKKKRQNIQKYIKYISKIE